MVYIFHCGQVALISARLSMRWAQGPFAGEKIAKTYSDLEKAIRKNSIVQTLYRLELEVSVNKEAFKRTREHLSCFVKTANLDQSYTAYEVFKQYKAQRNLETSFKFLEDPLFAGPVFFKKPSRIQALTYVLLIALLIFNLLDGFNYDCR